MPTNNTKEEKRSRIETVTCSKCKEKREIRRKSATLPGYSFWCLNCKKEVAQALIYQPNQK